MTRRVELEIGALHVPPGVDGAAAAEAIRRHLETLLAGGAAGLPRDAAAAAARGIHAALPPLPAPAERRRRA